MTHSSNHHPHDPIARELHDLLDYEAAVDDALAVAGSWRTFDASGDALPDAYCLQVTVNGRRRLLLSLEAARRAVRRAKEQGNDVTVRLRELRDVAPAHAHIPGRHEVYRDALGRLVPNTLPEGGAA